MTIDVAVVGGGVSGLAVAWQLQQQGYRVVVLERQVRAGGNAVSERIGGFLMEHGPSTVSATTPAADRMSTALGIDRLQCDLGPDVRHRYLLGGERLHRISTHPLGFLLAAYLSPAARLRVLAEPLVPRQDSDPDGLAKDESVGDFIGRRFGPEFAARVIDPLVGGLFAGRAEALSMAATFPALVEMERRHGSVVRALIKRRRSGGRMPGRRLFSWSEGVATLPRFLARDLGPAVRCGVAVRRIRPLPGGVRIDAGGAGSFEASAVVLATQPHVAAMLLEGVDADAAAAAGEIEAPPLSVAYLGFRRAQVDHPLDGLGYLTPSCEGRPLTGALFCSTMFAGRAPDGHVALSAYIGGDRAPDLARQAPADLIDQARGEFRELLGARGEPVVAQTRHWPRGLPQYRPGHGRLIETLLGIEVRRPGLFLTGNYVAGPGIASCLAQAARTAARVDARLCGLCRVEGRVEDRRWTWPA